MGRYPCQVDVFALSLCGTWAVSVILLQLPLTVNDINSDVFKVLSCPYEHKSDCRVHLVDEEVI